MKEIGTVVVLIVGGLLVTWAVGPMVEEIEAQRLEDEQEQRLDNPTLQQERQEVLDKMK